MPEFFYLWNLMQPGPVVFRQPSPVQEDHVKIITTLVFGIIVVGGGTASAQDVGGSVDVLGVGVGAHVGEHGVGAGAHVGSVASGGAGVDDRGVNAGAHVGPVGANAGAGNHGAGADAHVGPADAGVGV